MASNRRRSRAELHFLPVTGRRPENPKNAIYDGGIRGKLQARCTMHFADRTSS
ncbi:unnamed protein product, partial [Nesidiocoris tenuis]